MYLAHPRKSTHARVYHASCQELPFDPIYSFFQAYRTFQTPALLFHFSRSPPDELEHLQCFKSMHNIRGPPRVGRNFYYKGPNSLSTEGVHTRSLVLTLVPWWPSSRQGLTSSLTQIYQTPYICRKVPTLLPPFRRQGSVGPLLRGPDTFRYSFSKILHERGTVYGSAMVSSRSSICVEKRVEVEQVRRRGGHAGCPRKLRPIQTILAGCRVNSRRRALQPSLKSSYCCRVAEK